MRFAIGVEYDGSAFSGWQRQLNENTIQNKIESALAAICGHSLTLHAAGRTDAGVHASAQLAHFDTEVKRPLTAWVRGVNSHLPNSISVIWVKEVDDSFHARFSARSRSYSYFLLNQAVRPALLAGRVGWYFQELKLDLMREAAQILVGTHDFSSFRASACQAKSPIKTLHKLEIRLQDNLFCFDFCANAFLHHMVRNIVGALIYVGKGSLSINAFAELLNECNRSKAPPTFMPDGLYLTGVNYPEQYALPSETGLIRPIGLY